MKKKRVAEAAELLRERAGGALDAAVILGSGFGGVLRDRFDAAPIRYAKIPGMPTPTVAGHAGIALVGELHGRRVCVFSGRFHLYEGRAVSEVVYPVAIASAAGARTMILTNAGGGLNLDFRAGDLMLIGDHLNLTGANPLAGDALSNVPDRFVDMSRAYAPHLRDLARHIAQQYGIVLHTGVYAGLLGPTYETPAEVRMLRTMGADAVGMSTVLEAIAARAYGAEVVAFSLITNVHDGAPTSHGEVLAASRRSAEDVARLVEGIVANLDGPGTGLPAANGLLAESLAAELSAGAPGDAAAPVDASMTAAPSDVLSVEELPA